MRRGRISVGICEGLEIRNIAPGTVFCSNECLSGSELPADRQGPICGEIPGAAGAAEDAAAPSQGAVPVGAHAGSRAGGRSENYRHRPLRFPEPGQQCRGVSGYFPWRSGRARSADHRGEGAVPVGAGKAGVQGELVQLCSEALSAVKIKGVKEAAAEPDIAAVAIATRPDCLPPEVLSVLAELAARAEERARDRSRRRRPDRCRAGYEEAAA